MNDLHKLIGELGTVRKVPQFLFWNKIAPSTSIKTRRAIYDYKLSNPDSEEIDFIILSGGGSPDDAYRIISSLRSTFTTVNIIVPFWAKSAATLLSFGGSQIIMSEFGEFGALDVQLLKKESADISEERESALIDEIALEELENRAMTRWMNMYLYLRASEYTKLFSRNETASIASDFLSKFYEPLLEQIDPYRIGEKKRNLDIATKYAERILSTYTSTNDGDAKELIGFLVKDCPNHGFVVDYEIMKHFLPHVKQSKEIGPEYETKLREISFYILENFSEIQSFIGFIAAIEPAPASTPLVVMPESNGQDEDAIHTLTQSQ